MALPASPQHRRLVEQIRAALDELSIAVFWVEALARRLHAKAH
jgi:hypothetical protein